MITVDSHDYRLVMMIMMMMVVVAMMIVLMCSIIMYISFDYMHPDHSQSITIIEFL